MVENGELNSRVTKRNWKEIKPAFKQWVEKVICKEIHEKNSLEEVNGSKEDLVSKEDNKEVEKLDDAIEFQDAQRTKVETQACLEKSFNKAEFSSTVQDVQAINFIFPAEFDIINNPFYYQACWGHKKNSSHVKFWYHSSSL
ncbi:hypothetical protein SLEP1_g22278 [Rubroshorea leprosula]|uniref:Uncharacterized protein n=1 Tax=Rubroshorea leprosula TaxID=152421 RepID=A0AAV5JFZ6_9ROSI|nr:hypothetical protein SLEP1_g22278 [Rubroshorea leprosula]